MNVIFFGSSDYCLSILETLQKKFNLVAVVTKSHNMRTAEQSETPYRPDLFGSGTGVKAFTPKDKAELLALKNDLIKLKPDLAIVADYGLIIPKEIFTIPRHKTLNIHFSRLPKYRGPSPVQYTILNGEKSVWITVILMDEGMDTGDIVFQKPFDFAQGKEVSSETTESLYRKLFLAVSQELPQIIHDYVNKKLTPVKQPTTGVSYTRHFTRQDGFIPFSQLVKSPILIERKIRAFSPWPGVWTEVTMKQSDNETMIKKRLKILKAHIENSKLVLDLVQLEGKKPVTWKQFLEGYPNFSF